MLTAALIGWAFVIALALVFGVVIGATAFRDWWHQS